MNRLACTQGVPQAASVSAGAGAELQEDSRQYAQEGKAGFRTSFRAPTQKQKVCVQWHSHFEISHSESTLDHECETQILAAILSVEL